MKALPILVVTNALALGLVLLLYLQQEDLKSQISNPRSSATSRDVPADIGFASRIAKLEAWLAASRGVGEVLDDVTGQTAPWLSSQ